MFVLTPRQSSPTQEHLGLFVVYFGAHLFINSPEILCNSLIFLPILHLYVSFKNREKILSDLWELALSD